MAIYHLHAKLIQRSQGKSVVAAAAYRHATKMSSTKEEQTFDYSKKQGVVYTEVLIPPESPFWLSNLVLVDGATVEESSEKLWNLIETIEKRKDAQLAREIEFSLPLELTQEQNIALAREFIHDQFVLRGMVADLAVHWDEGNPHVHVLLSMREITPEGFGQKITAWNNKLLLQTWREKWAEYANFHLRLHQVSARIDHRSYEEQGIELVPGIHEGKAINDMERRGIKTDIMQEANSIRRENLARISANPSVLLNKLTSQNEDFTAQQMGQELGRCINDRHKFAVLESPPLSPTNLESLTGSIASASLLTPETIAGLFETLEQHASVFTDKDLAKALSLHTDHGDLFLHALTALKASESLIHLGPGDDGRMRYTTARMIAIENDIQQKADILRERGHLKLSNRAIQTALAEYQQQTGKQLTKEQLNAVHHLLKTNAIACVVGRAGTGKSFSLGAAKAVWEKHGQRVLGVALSGIAADGLSKDAGIDARTIESFRYALENGVLTLDANSVLIMDEAGMTDSPAMQAVLTAVEQAQAKVVLVGDHAQLQPVGPGASFRALLERLGFAELYTVYRQKQAWQREATVALSAGDVAKGLSAYEEKGCLHTRATAADALSLLVTHWVNLHDTSNHSLANQMVLTHRNEDVRALNEQLRAALVARGKLAQGHGVKTATQKINIAIGERLLFLKNDRQLGVSNGRLATVTSVILSESGEALGFDVQLDGSNKLVRIDPNTYGHFTLGYAATVHKSQGITVDHSFVYAGGLGWNRHLTYVALSRHKDSCHIYTSQETHTDRMALMKNLGRLGLKDSVLDYPLAFAERRNITLSGLSQLLPSHLAFRLSRLSQTVRAAYEQRMDPESYRQRQEEKAHQAQKIENQAQQREDAKTVAAYVDAHQAVGKTWQSVQDKLAQLGFAKMPDEKEAFHWVAQTQEYTELQTAFQQRNELASTLVKEPARYQKAIEIYGLDLKVLHTQAENHQALMRALEYQRLMKLGATVLQGRQAALIYANIKAHYPAIKSLGIDTKTLRADAIAHCRRQLFSRLTAPEREPFSVVEAYKAKNLEVAHYYERYIKPYEIAAVHRQHVIALETLKNERDGLAATILQNPAVYDKALNFYHIGLAVPYFDETPTPEQCRYAKERWEKLQQNAARHHAKEKVKGYLNACENPTIVTRLTLAAEIMQATKSHYAAMKQLGIDTGDGLFLQIWHDAKRYHTLTFYKTLNAAERQGFKLVKAYVDAKHAHSGAWRELFKSREMAGVDEVTFYQKMTPFAAHYTHARNALAASVQTNPAACKAGLTHFEIKPEELNASAYAHHCREHAQAFIQAPLGIARGKAALDILADLKNHYKALHETAINRHELYRWGKVAERHLLLSQFTPQEKRFLRLMEKYHRYHCAVGKTYGTLKAASEPMKLSRAAQQKLDTLTAKRDSLAYRLMLSKETMNTSAIDLNSVRRLNWDKVERQAQSHQKKKAEILTWREADTISKTHLAKIAAVNTVSREQAVNRLVDWSIDREDSALDKLTEKILASPKQYQAALAEIGIGEKKLQHHQTNVAVLKESLSRWIEQVSASNHTPAPSLRDAQETQRLNDVLKTLRATKPIAGSLAERYLREHRGIQCPLNKTTFRYHPHLKNKITGTYHPALMIVARDKTKQACGLQAIFLDPLSAKKAALGKYTKLSDGKTGEGALIQQGTPTGNVAFAEGPETALSIAQAKPDWTVYVTFGVRNFDKVPLKTSASKIILCADNDGPGSGTEKAIEAAAHTLSLAGKDVWVALPDKPDSAKKWDFNDTLITNGTPEMIKYLDNAQLHRSGITKERLENIALTSALAISQEKEMHRTTPTSLIDQYNLKDIVKHYVEMEIEQTALVRERDKMRMHDRIQAKALSEKAILHSQKLSALAQEMIKNPEVAQAAKDLTHGKAPRPAARGGYKAISERFAQGEFASEDIKAVIAQLRQRGLEWARVQAQDRHHRGGRTQ